MGYDDAGICDVILNTKILEKVPFLVSTRAQKFLLVPRTIGQIS